MDLLTQEEFNRHTLAITDFKAKYDTRYQRGDIVEVREDGHWTGPKAKGFNKNSFALVTRAGLELIQSYTDSVVEIINEGTDDEVKTLIKRRAHKIDLTQLALVDDKVEVTERQLTDILSDKRTPIVTERTK